MREGVLAIAAAFALACPPAAMAADAGGFSPGNAVDNQGELPAYLQCVPYARDRSGVQIYGDALTWWDQAAGRYARGNRPKPGAVMAFRPSGNMVLGHVAAVSKVIDSRTVLLDHANWSPINGRRGQIERGVEAVDVSPNNDWSEVRVWYDPLQALGTTAWPVAGFIYANRERAQPLVGARTYASAGYEPPAAARPVTSPKPSRNFADAFASLGEPTLPMAPREAGLTRVAVSAPIRRVTPAKPRDPLDAALARYNP